MRNDITLNLTWDEFVMLANDLKCLNSMLGDPFPGCAAAGTMSKLDALFEANCDVSFREESNAMANRIREELLQGKNNLPDGPPNDLIQETQE